MSDATPTVGDPLPPPGQPEAPFWQQATPPPLPEHAGPAPIPERPSEFGPPPIQQPLGPATRGSEGIRLAGFWRRAWARGITLLYWSAITGLGLVGISAGAVTLYSAAPNRIILAVGQVLSITYGVTVTYLIWSRSLANHRGTIGMRQMGVAIRGAGKIERLSRGDAFRRSAIALLPLAYWTGLPFLVLYNPDPDLVAILALVGAGLTLLVVLGGFWMLVSPRRQTVWDLVGDTVVVAENEPSWLAVAGLALGLLVPVAAAVAIVAIGVDLLRSDFQRRSILDASGQYLRYSIPVFVVSLVAIIVGHLAVRATKWDARRLSGRGIARIGLMLGYSFPVAVALILAFSLLYRTVEDRQQRSCSDERTAIAEAAESYKTLNGVYPDSVAPLGGGVYLDSSDLAERWTFTPAKDQATATKPYRTVGKGECAKS